MKITVYGRPLLNKGTGIGQYIYNLLWEFTRLDQQHEYYISGINVFLRKLAVDKISDLTDYAQTIRQLALKIPFPLKKISRILIDQYTPVAMRMSGMDLFWGTNYLGYFNSSFSTVITIHDMAYQYYPEFIHPVIYRKLKQELYEHSHRAHAIITDSECTKKDIMKFLGIPSEKIRVIYPGVGCQFHPIRDRTVLEQTQRRYNLPRLFILFVGMLEPRKNVVGLIRAFHELTKDPQIKHNLVIVGNKGWLYKEIFKTVETLGLKERVVFTGYVPDDDLTAIYNLADVFVYPSFYEGFGIPIVEAMACGVPVITSNASSLPEVGGNACLYIDPNSIDDITQSLRNCLQDQNLREALSQAGLARAKEFTWQNAAIKILREFEEVVNRG